MNSTIKKAHNLKLRKNRVRSKVFGTAQRPRLTVSISNLHVSAQIINDETSRTLVSATSVGKTIGNNLSEKAKIVGTEIAQNAKKAKIKKVVFDRNGRIYHGRIKALAESARAGGLEF